MSLLFSPPCRLEERNLLFPERHHFPPYSSILPEEGRWIPDIYNCANFYEKVSCIPHRDGQQVIIYWMPDECYNWRETAARGVKRLKKTYEKLDRNHPRIVRYNGPLDGAIGGEHGEKIGGLLVEKLSPGPLQYLDLPAFANPKSPTSSQKDMLILSLYYHWALQSLSAISYLHSQGVFLRVFSSQMVWVRSDFSLAITGFINAIHRSEFTYTSDIHGYHTSEEYDAELPREDDGMISDEWVTYQDENGSEVPGVKEDLFQWATFVWRLMTTGEQLHPHWLWDPNSQRPDDPIADYGQNKDTLEAAMRERDASGNMWQELEEERLGRVLVKAWNGGYESAGDAMTDIRAIAVSTGVTAHGDEVNIDQVWEDVFEVVQQGDGPWERELRARTPIAECMFEEWVKI